MTGKRITVLTGAGISAESGIPTFRGPEGYWTIGSRNFFPEQMATAAMFAQAPDEVWKWYLYRLSVCHAAEPNHGHHVLVEMEHRLQDRFTLITQNVDGLHLRAGNSAARMMQIHGNIYFMRCTRSCTALSPLPLQILPRTKEQPLSVAEKRLLSCVQCGSAARPHVLWFDESYDEHYFHFDSALAAADKTDVLIIAGTSGATTLPNLIVESVYRNGGSIIDINIAESPFTPIALASPHGRFINRTCSEGLTELVSSGILN